MNNTSNMCEYLILKIEIFTLCSVCNSDLTSLSFDVVNS